MKTVDGSADWGGWESVELRTECGNVEECLAFDTPITCKQMCAHWGTPCFRICAGGPKGQEGLRRNPLKRDLIVLHKRLEMDMQWC